MGFQFDLLTSDSESKWTCHITFTTKSGDILSGIEISVTKIRHGKKCDFMFAKPCNFMFTLETVTIPSINYCFFQKKCDVLSSCTY